MDTKAVVRTRVRQRRRALSALERAEKSAVISRLALGLARSADKGYVFCYLSVGAEVDTASIISELMGASVRLCVPVVDGDKMCAVRCDEGTTFTAGALGIPQPVSGCVVSPDAISVILLPLVAFDLAGNRLGQGGGYYDKFMTSQAFRVGLAFSCQQDSFPVEGHDLPLDAVVTEDGIRIFNENYCRKTQG